MLSSLLMYLEFLRTNLDTQTRQSLVGVIAVGAIFCVGSYFAWKDGARRL